MFKLNAVQGRKDATTEKSDDTVSALQPRQLHLMGYVLDGVIVLAMGAILFWGISTQFPNQYNDVTRYQCYANVFWQGPSGLAPLPPKQCAFLSGYTSTALVQKLQAHHIPQRLISLIESQPTDQALHALPPEYPLLTLVPFTLGLVAPQAWYQIAFALWMVLVAGIIYFVLKNYQSRSAAIAFAVYLAIGSWATAAGRFDLIPAGLTLGAVILAGRSRWKSAFALLALATMLKFYPVVLVLPFLIAQQRPLKEKWLSWQRWKALGVFVAICVGLTVVSLLLNIADTLSPFTYFLNRPTQIESLQASLLWLGHLAGYPFQETFTYQSLNVLSPLSSKVSLLGYAGLSAGLLYTFWLQWRGKIDVAMASLLTLLVLMLTGKVFSPQYLMWVTPLIAYVGRGNWKWLLGWGAVGALTTFIFPYMYDNFVIDKYFWVIVARNGLMLVFVLALLWYAARGHGVSESVSKE